MPISSLTKLTKYGVEEHDTTQSNVIIKQLIFINYASLIPHIDILDKVQVKRH
jgi:hypothetical protein